MGNRDKALTLDGSYLGGMRLTVTMAIKRSEYYGYTNRRGCQRCGIASTKRFRKRFYEDCRLRIPLAEHVLHCSIFVALLCSSVTRRRRLEISSPRLLHFSLSCKSTRLTSIRGHSRAQLLNGVQSPSLTTKLLRRGSSSLTTKPSPLLELFSSSLTTISGGIN
ncbi:Uncharacterized protein Rs2_49583 [Raphanus sativus]|nr:Uncharacterized protein Rs2_49583 [Raphanus sativus]